MTTNGPADPTAAPAGLPQIPEVELIAELARGGMGVVYRGRQPFLARDVAVKLLSPELGGDKFAARFRREARLLASIRHPNIVACHTAGTAANGQSYLVMEYVDGPDLKAWIAAHGPATVAATLQLGHQVASALAHASALGVIHRDVKAENILLEPTAGAAAAFPFAARLVDLGIARLGPQHGDLSLTATGAVVGTPATMAPEQFDAPDIVDYRVDIYGLGCVLYEMLTGAPAFASSRLTDLIVQKRAPRGPDPAVARPGIPAAVGELVTSMLASDPAARPRDYAALIARLEALAQAEACVAAAPAARGGGGLLQTAEFEFLAAGGPSPSPTTRPTVAFGASTAAVEPSPPAAKRRSRVRWLVGMTVLASAALAAVPAWRHWRLRDDPPQVAPPPSPPIESTSDEPGADGVADVAGDGGQDLFADFLQRGSPWIVRPRARDDWSRADDGAVVCAADDFPSLCGLPVQGDRWQLSGRLRPERGRRGYAQTAVCMRVGVQQQLAIVCTREGVDGERWSVALMEVDRDDPRAGLQLRPLRRQPKQVVCVDEHGDIDAASWMITRRGDELVFEFGLGGAGLFDSHRERVRPGGDAMLSLFARGGDGVFLLLERR